MGRCLTVICLPSPNLPEKTTGNFIIDETGRLETASCPPRMNFTRRCTLIFITALLLTRAYAEDDQREMNVNVAMTEAGKKVAPPTKDHPTYYLPYVVGYREEGATVAGEKAPPMKPIVHQLAKALAQQNYFVISKDHAQPSILLVFYWGYMNPQIDDVGDLDNPQKVFYNQKEMLALVGGQTMGMLDLNFEKEQVMQGAEDDRYFVVVSAYDFDAAKQHKKVILWQARMSTPSNGVSLDQVIPALIASGAPKFGRETIRPEWVMAPVVPQGKVEVGTPVVKDYLDAPAAPATPAKK